MIGTEALVLASGGLDSTTCMAWAKENYVKVRAITFRYGQRHSIETVRAIRIAGILDVPIEAMDIPKYLLHSSGLTSDDPARAGVIGGDGLPKTFVPARNLIFLSIAAGLAYRGDSSREDLVIGVNEVDYSGYPDCRPESILAIEQAIRRSLGTDNIAVRIPLQGLSKPEIILKLMDLRDDWVELLKHSMSCYNGVDGGCGTCDSCVIRQDAFKMLHIKDPAKKGTQNG